MLSLLYQIKVFKINASTLVDLVESGKFLTKPKYTENNLIKNHTDILLVDTYGEALKFYDISKSVFIGKFFSVIYNKDSKSQSFG